MESITGDEKVFYTHQQTKKECCLSEKIDENYESLQEPLHEIKLQQKQQHKTEH